MKTVNGVEKPLAEWTLKDCKEFCNNTTDCNNCNIEDACKYPIYLWEFVNGDSDA